MGQKVFDLTKKRLALRLWLYVYIHNYRNDIPSRPEVLNSVWLGSGWYGQISGHSAIGSVSVEFMAHLTAWAGSYAAIISATLLTVPKTNAKIPTMISTTFRSVIQMVTSFQYVANSMRTGTTMPRSEKQKAPMSPMKGPIVGTATAISTVKYSHTNVILLL